MNSVKDSSPFHPGDEIQEVQECADLLGILARPVAPSPSVKERLLSRVGSYEALKPLAEVRREEGKWKESGLDGVRIKTLFRDPVSSRTTVLVRMEPGSRFAAHRHHDDEQCLVLSGDIRWQDLVYEEGDFVVMPKDTEHPEIYTVEGNVLLIISGHNEFVHR